MNKESNNVSNQSLTTYCYSFEVKTIVQVFSDNDEHANVMLDAGGGYVSRREVNLLDTKIVYSED